MFFEYFERPGLTLTERILKLIPDNPQILDMENPRELFDIEGFYCDDLKPDWYQAAWAFERAKMIYRGGG